MKHRRANALKRRNFLRGAGGVALATPFLSSVHEQMARAQATPTGAPQRLVIFFTHNGCLTNRWFPEKEDGALTAEDLAGKTLEPLTPYIDKLLIPRGFRSMNAYAQGQTIDPHDQAVGSKLTCATIDETNNRYATARSLDHEVASQINPNGADPLVLSVGKASTSIKEVLSFSAPGTAFPSNVSPRTVYNSLTGVFGSDGGGEPVSEADYRVKLGESAIDLVTEELARYQALNMSVRDQQRIESWLDLLRDTEQVVVSGECSAGALGITEAAVDEASPTGSIDGGVFGGGAGGGFGTPGGTASTEARQNLATSFTLGGDMMLNLITLSLICDTNRSIIMNYPGYVIFGWDGIDHQNDHHGLSHRTGDLSVGGACGVENVLDKIAEIDRWYAGKYTKLVGLLDSLSEGDGTLLDNTATMWLPELSDGNAHNLNNLPIVIAGGAGGYIKQGAIVNVEGNNIGVGASEDSCQNGGNIGNTGSRGGNVPINKLYVTLMNAVGCTAADGGPVTEFGQFDGTGSSGGITSPGELAALKA